MSVSNSRERLMEVAEGLFARQGYQSTSVREIVQGLNAIGFPTRLLGTSSMDSAG